MTCGGSGTLRRQLGVVPQEHFLLGTSPDNLAFGRPGAGEAVLGTTARTVVDELVGGFPAACRTRSIRYAGQSLFEADFYEQATRRRGGAAGQRHWAAARRELPIFSIENIDKASYEEIS
jgi:hypothetical protein